MAKIWNIFGDFLREHPLALAKQTVSLGQNAAAESLYDLHPAAMFLGNVAVALHCQWHSWGCLGILHPLICVASLADSTSWEALWQKKAVQKGVRKEE